MQHIEEEWIAGLDQSKNNVYVCAGSSLGKEFESIDCKSSG